jgi:S1/P1 Nuclease
VFRIVIMRRLCFLVLILLSPVASFAWSHGGHMLVAKIAYDRLNPRAQAEADRLLAIPVTPADVTARSTNFVESSHWADDVKHLPGFEYSGPLHFVDYPFSPDGTPLPPDMPPTNNVVRALQDYVTILQTSTNDTDRAAALRFIIHFVGDIHQPLHCVSRITSALPDGDQGGNKFSIINPDAAAKSHHLRLHAYWDDGLDTFPKMGLHWAPPPIAEVLATVPPIIAGNPATNAQWQTGGPFNYADWAKESAQLAQTVVYTGIAEDQIPDEHYRQVGLKVVHQRIAWAGYRLAALLNAIWPRP